MEIYYLFSTLTNILWDVISKTLRKHDQILIDQIKCFAWILADTLHDNLIYVYLNLYHDNKLI